MIRVKIHMLRWVLSAGMFATAMAAAGCVTGTAGAPGGETRPPVSIEDIRLLPEAEGNAVEIRCSAATPYSAFKRMHPPRIVVDILGEPGPDLPRALYFKQGPVKRITSEGIGEDLPNTRVVVYPEGEPDYRVAEEGDAIILRLVFHESASERVPAGRFEKREPREKQGKSATGPGVSPAPRDRAPVPVNSLGTRSPGFPGTDKDYSGTPMTMEFVDADVPNILRLIGEVSDFNILWGPEVKGTVSMKLRGVPWDQVLDLVLADNGLAKRVRGKVIWVTTRKKLEALKAAERKTAEEERKRRLAEAQELKELEPLDTRYFPLDFANANQIKSHLDGIRSKDRGTLTVDERTNTLIMRDTAAILAEAGKMVERFDTPVKQIMIEARIVDAMTGFSRDLGVEWGAGYERYRDRSPFSGSFATNAPKGWAGNMGFAITRLTSRGLATLDASLALAETENKVTIISAPRVIASNGEEAVISRGAEMIREIVTADQIGLETVEAALSLIVTPTVSFNNFVTMELKVTDDKPCDDGSGNINKKQIETTLMVKSGETIVIGGIYTEDRQEVESGIPVLRNIPALSWLFKARRRIKDKTELLIFITPRVIETARPNRPSWKG
jgi:type IV pilus assembly protein PilQ